MPSPGYGENLYRWSHNPDEPEGQFGEAADRGDRVEDAAEVEQWDDTISPSPSVNSMML